MQATSNSGGRCADAATSRDEALRKLLAKIRSRRDEFRARRHVPADIIARFCELGVYRAMVAKTFGGDELGPGEFCRLIEAIAQADGSAGWVASFGASATYLAALPEPTLRKVYARGPDVVFAGGLFPLQPARRVNDGVVVKGRWKFASGCIGASIVGVGIKLEGEQGDGLPRVAVLPADQVRIEDNWDVMGLQGTGSHDIVVDDVLVPQEWTLIRGGKASVDAAVNRYPTLALAAQVLAVVGLGVARAALDEVLLLSGGQKSITGAPRLADRPYVQSELAKAEASLRSARSFFYDATDEAWSMAQTGDPVTLAASNLLRLAATHAARTAADVSRVAFGLAGTTAIYSGHGLPRALTDSLVVAQHAFLNEGTLQSSGGILLGLPASPGFP